MLGIESLGLNSPLPIVVLIFYLIFLVLSFLALEGLDYAKILRRPYHTRALLLHLLLSLALAYLSTNFILAVIYKG
ncbi:MAG: DUF1146 domain-containing protein [Erysipelothrix sp.]|nr:DUF1146 domain-containing protein [Erysipelothrix sp.]